MQAFVPKTRRPKFDLQLKIIDLNNVPLVSGTSLVKWHLPHSSSAEHRGRTVKCHIKEHKVTYDYVKQLTIKLTVDKTGTLQESSIHFEVLQEYSSGARGERITLGNVRLNLAEYVDASELDGEDGVCRRYLMQDSKINSTLKIGIRMKLVDGDHNFIAPPLKTAPVFGGIAGIMAGETGESDETGHMPNLTSKSRETGETQDMYRRNLAAYWTAQPGELRADDCIEDIFAGGDGWAANTAALGRNDGGRQSVEDERGASGRGGLGHSGITGGSARDEYEHMTSVSAHRKTPDRLDVPRHGNYQSHRHKALFGSGSPRLRPNSGGAHALGDVSLGIRFDNSRREASEDSTRHNSTSNVYLGRPGSSGSSSIIADGIGGSTFEGGVDRDMIKRGSLEQHAHEMKAEAAHNRYRTRNEIDEFHVRNDLRSWHLPGTVN